MNKIILTFLLSITFLSLGWAQDNEKIKGDRNVTIQQTYIDPFNKISVGEDFTVELIYNKKESVEIEADSNLHEYIGFEVVNGVLSFQYLAKITSSKKLAIKVNYGDDLKAIEVNDKAEVRSLTSLELKDADLVTNGNSRAYLNIRSENFKYLSTDKARTKLNISCTAAKVILNDNTKSEITFNTKTLNIDMSQRASANVEGIANHSLVRLENSSSFNGKAFNTKTAETVLDMSSSVTLGVEESIAIDSSGNSEIYLYNSPKIVINRFLGTSKLQKKE